MQKSRRFMFWMVVMGLLLVGLSTAWADTNWNVSSGDWSSADNWTAGEPTSSVTARINNGGTAQITLNGEECAGFYVGDGNGTGTVNMTGGTLTSATGYEAFIGDVTHAGNFTQTGGTVTIGAPGTYGDKLYVGRSYLNSTDVSTYTLQGGTLTVGGIEYVSRSAGRGHFIQSGGTHTPTYIEVGHYYSGLYELQGGDLSAFQILLGEIGGSGDSGDIIQTGGTCTGDYIFIGYLSAGSYTISGGTLTATGSVGEIELGLWGNSGTFTVIGDNATINANYWNHEGTAMTGNVMNFQFDANGISTINVVGSANIGGTLNVTDPNNNAPFGQFSLLTAGGGITGTFTTVNLPSAYWSWGIDHVTNTVWVMHSSGLTADTPTFTPDSNNYPRSALPLSVTISCTTPGAIIHYTTDGSTPTLSSPTGTSVVISSPAPITLQAKAWASGYNESAVGSAVYTFMVTTYWNVSDGDWSVTSNWTDGEPASNDNATVSNDGTVRITQNGEVCTVLHVGGTAGTGTVVMTGGSLTTTTGYEAFIGDTYSAGNFTQTGGTVTIGAPGTYGDKLYVGRSYLNSTDVSTYTLQGGTLTVGGIEYVSRSGGRGHFIQSGGTHTPTYIEVGHYYSGLYELQGGDLSAFQILLGEIGGSGDSGDIIQTGGTCTGDYIFIGYLSAGSYTISGGTLTATGSVGEIELGLWGNSGTFTVIGDNATINTNYWNHEGTSTAGNVMNFQFNANGISTINVLGSANIGGTLNVTDPNNNAPLGRFSLLTAGGGITGTFATVNLPNSNWSWGVDTANNTVWAQNGEVAATPIFSVASGVYAMNQTVSISCATPGANIHYTTDESTPTLSSPTYSGSITVDHTMTLKARAWASGYAPSGIASAAYTIPRPKNIPPGTATIDGNLSDWDNAIWAPLNQVYYETPTNITEAYYSVKWSENKVYVAVKVRDTNHVLSDSYNYSNCDMVEIYLHTTGTGPLNYTSTQADAQQYEVGIKSSDPNAVWKTIIGGPIPSQANFSAAGKVNGEWLYYEAAITPFEAFDLTGVNMVPSPLSAGDVIGVDVVASTASPFGMMTENLLRWKSNDYSKIGIHVLTDLPIVLSAMDTVQGGPGFDSRADLDDDGEITSTDLSIILSNMD